MTSMLGIQVRKYYVYLLVLIVALLLQAMVSRVVLADPWNGFNVQGALIPVTAIEQGGPPRDGIPTIDRPRFTAVADTDWLRADDRVLAIERNGVARAYPVAILNWHEIVNDTIGGEAITVTFCPLCGTGIAFKSVVNGQKLRFAVSGLLYNSDVLLYDRETQSLWSQIMGKAVTGKLKGVEFQRIVMSHTTWQAWKADHPDGQVLSRDTGITRDYARSPYQGYENSRSVWFSLSNQDDRMHPKAWVVGVQRGDSFKAYPFGELALLRDGIVRDEVGGEKITVRYDAGSRSAVVTDQAGMEIPAIAAYWFAWYAFHPDTEVFRFAR